MVLWTRLVSPGPKSREPGWRSGRANERPGIEEALSTGRTGEHSRASESKLRPSFELVTTDNELDTLEFERIVTTFQSAIDMRIYWSLMISCKYLRYVITTPMNVQSQNADVAFSSS